MVSNLGGQRHFRFYAVIIGKFISKHNVDDKEKNDTILIPR